MMTGTNGVVESITRELNGEPTEDDERFMDEWSQAGTTEAPAIAWSTLDELIPAALARAEARADGREKSIPIPWATVAEHFGGGMWPGLHVLCSSTGIGKTALAMNVSLHAARAGIPVAYVALELESFQLALRMLADEAHVPWSLLYTGKAGPELRRKAGEAAPRLAGLPLKFVTSTPRGWPASSLEHVTERLRVEYPEQSGAGSRPALVVLDFLQLVAAEPGARSDLRERISNAAYLARELAARHNVAIFAISSVARDKHAVLSRAFAEAGLTYQTDDEGRPQKRGMLSPDALVGLGKESGDVEFAADSVSVLFRVPGTWAEGYGCDVVFATPKGRATGGKWTVLRFTGFRYDDAPDGGAGAVRAIEEAKKRRGKKADGVDPIATRALEDAILIARHLRVKEQAGEAVSVRAARLLVGDASARWRAAKDELGSALVTRKPVKNGLAASLVIVADRLSDEIREALGFAPRESDDTSQLSLGGTT